MKGPDGLLSSVPCPCRKRRLIVAQNMIPKANYFLVGFGEELGGQ